MKGFDYLCPSSLEEACAALAGTNGWGASDDPVKALAGGTDLLVQIKLGNLQPRTLVSLRGVPGLAFVRVDGDGALVIGAATTLAAVEDSSEVRSVFPAIAEAAACIGSVQVRNRATVGGNLCNAAPSADTAPILIAAGAEAIISDGRADRSVLLEEFFTGPGETVLKRGELLKALRVPAPPASSFAKYFKTFRSAMDCCTVGVAVFAAFDAQSMAVDEARLALGAVAPTPLRARAAESMVIGRQLDDGLIARAAARAAEEARPISDVRASAAYRKTLVEVLSKRALRAARAWAEKGASP